MLNPIIREHLISGLQTFLATFLLAMGTFLSSGVTIEWTSAYWASLIMTAGRAGVKELFARLAPTSLGGRD